MSKQSAEELLANIEQASEFTQDAGHDLRDLGHDLQDAGHDLLELSQILDDVARKVSHDAATVAGRAAGQDIAGGWAIDPFVFQFSIFVLAIFVGYYVVWSVTPALHTPLMSVTNAISSVIVAGALLAVAVEPVSDAFWSASRSFGTIALVLASINIFGGFLVTARMLAMYKKKRR